MLPSISSGLRSPAAETTHTERSETLTAGTEAPRLLLATNNAGKVREFRSLLEGCGWDIVTPADLGLDLDVEETGETYAENAALKAKAYAAASGLFALADDSGIEVDALGGAPGVRSARYGGDLGEGEQVALLLRALEGIPDSHRTARFRAVIVVADPAGETRSFEGVIEGQIAHAPAGRGGFGYDPVFLPEGESRTTAEMPAAEKNGISHRARAARQARTLLVTLAGAMAGRGGGAPRGKETT